MLSHCSHSILTPCQPVRADLPTPKYFCQYSKQPVSVCLDFLGGRGWGGRRNNQSKHKSVKGQFFYQSSCKNSAPRLCSLLCMYVHPKSSQMHLHQYCRYNKKNLRVKHTHTHTHTLSFNFVSNVIIEPKMYGII